MKELKQYVCDFCGTVYKDKNDCKKCENTHKKPKKIVSERYNAYKSNIKGYPIIIDVEMEDGTVVRYKS